MSDNIPIKSEKEIKRRFQLWLKPTVLDMAEELYRRDNCTSRSEYIEKAIQFYSGYLYAKDAGDYLPKIIISTLKGIVKESDNRISQILFKMAVEQAITMNVVAATCGIERSQIDKLRNTCLTQVKKSNGAYSFEDAYDFQKK